MAKEELLITIILTTLNSERYIARSIESCLNQTYRNLELLIVDGGSQDRTLEIVNGYADSRVRLIHQPENSGKLPGAINLGMENANGHFITWTQDDTWYEPIAIQTMLNHLEDNLETALVYCDYWIVGERCEIKGYYTVYPSEPRFFLTDDVIGQCFLFRREVFEQIGPQDVQYFPVHEIPWRIKIIQRFNVCPLHIPLMYYTLHNESLTGRIGGWELQRMMAQALLREKVIDQPYLRQRLAEIDIQESYESFIVRGDYKTFWRCATRGLSRDPRHLRNRGYIKLILASLMPGREVYRSRLLRNWQAQQQSLLTDQMARFLPKGLCIP